MYSSCKTVASYSCHMLRLHFRGIQLRCYSSSNDYFSDPGAPRVALTKDCKTIVMYHPEEPLQYAKTISIPRDDPRYTFESAEAKVRERLHEVDIATRPVENPSIQNMFPMYDRDVVPTVMELAGMFHTSKHPWFKKIRRRSRTQRFKTPW